MIFKHIASITTLLFISASVALGQSDMDDRKFRIGLQASPNFGWLRPDIKEISKDGLQPRMGFGYGVMVDYKFSDSPNYLLTSGFNITTNGGGLSEAWQTVVQESDTSYTFMGTNDRTYRLQYLNIPILLKLRTGDVGYMSYFGAIGLDAGFRLRALANDDYTWTVSPITLQPDDEDDIDIAKNMNFMRLALNVTLGAEYNLTGNTNIYAGIGIHNGFTNLFNKKDINRVWKPTNTGSPELDNNGNPIESQLRNAKSMYVSLNVGVFF